MLLRKEIALDFNVALRLSIFKMDDAGYMYISASRALCYSAFVFVHALSSGSSIVEPELHVLRVPPLPTSSRRLQLTSIRRVGRILCMESAWARGRTTKKVLRRWFLGKHPFLPAKYEAPAG